MKAWSANERHRGSKSVSCTGGWHRQLHTKKCQRQGISIDLRHFIIDNITDDDILVMYNKYTIFNGVGFDLSLSIPIHVHEMMGLSSHLWK